MVKNSQGQIALMVLIVSAISLALGLALSDRIRTDISTDVDEELLQKAFNAAESGIEYEIANPGSGGYVAPDGYSSADVAISDVVGDEIDFGEFVPANDYAHFWLVGHDSSGDIDSGDVYGGSSVDVCFDEYDGAMAVYYFGIDSSGDYGVKRIVYNITVAGSATNEIENGLSSGQTSGACDGFEVGIENVDTTGFATPLLIVIKPLFGGSRFGLVSDGGVFPSQGTIIESIGTVADVSTNLRVYQRWDPAVYLSFMLEGLSAENSISSD